MGDLRSVFVVLHDEIFEFTDVGDGLFEQADWVACGESSCRNRNQSWAWAPGP